jgi:hypothetical protein
VQVLSSLSQLTAVDRTAGTSICTVQVADALSRQWGAELTASRLLPLACPLLLCPALNPAQFREMMATVQVRAGCKCLS